MRVVVRDRTHGVPRPLRRYAREKVARLGGHLSVPSTAEIEFNTDSRRSQEPIHVVDLTLRLFGPGLASLRAREQGRDLATVIDLAIDKIDGEILRVKERLNRYP